MEQIKLSDVMPHFNNSQSELAKALGLSRQAVNVWFKEDKIPPLRAYQIKDIINDKENISG